MTNPDADRGPTRPTTGTSGLGVSTVRPGHDRQPHPTKGDEEHRDDDSAHRDDDCAHCDYDSAHRENARRTGGSYDATTGQKAPEPWRVIVVFLAGLFTLVVVATLLQGVESAGTLALAPALESPYRPATALATTARWILILNQDAGGGAAGVTVGGAACVAVGGAFISILITAVRLGT